MGNHHREADNHHQGAVAEVDSHHLGAAVGNHHRGAALAAGSFRREVVAVGSFQEAAGAVGKSLHLLLWIAVKVKAPVSGSQAVRGRQGRKSQTGKQTVFMILSASV